MMVNQVADSAASEQFTLRHAGAAGQSRFVQRIRRRYEQELALLPPGAPEAFDARMDAVPALGQHTAPILAELGFTRLDQIVGRNNVAPKGLAKPVALPAVQPADVDIAFVAPQFTAPSFTLGAFLAISVPLAALVLAGVSLGLSFPVTLAGFRIGAGQVAKHLEKQAKLTEI